jgi:UDP-N-acetylglucosamine 1-carboxyvinyltransferase
MTATDESCKSTGAEVGGRRRELRHEAGLTQSQLAVRLGTTQSAIARPDCGLYRTSLKLMIRVVAARSRETTMLGPQKRSA